MRKYVDAYFRPAVTNARKNLGEENVGERLLEDVCLTAIDRAKEALRVAVKLDFQVSPEYEEVPVYVTRRPV